MSFRHTSGLMTTLSNHAKRRQMPVFLADMLGVFCCYNYDVCISSLLIWYNLGNCYQNSISIYTENTTNTRGSLAPSPPPWQP